MNKLGSKIFDYLEVCQSNFCELDDCTEESDKVHLMYEGLLDIQGNLTETSFQYTEVKYILIF